MTLEGHQFSQVRPKSTTQPNPYLSGGDAEIRLVDFLHGQGRQIELLPENGRSQGKPDLAFDGKTWDSKYIPTANAYTIRTYFKDARKADCVIFSFEDIDRYQDIMDAVSREIGRYKGLGRDTNKLPDVYIFTKDKGLRLIKKIKGA